jgi:hypothetical protein
MGVIPVKCIDDDCFTCIYNVYSGNCVCVVCVCVCVCVCVVVVGCSSPPYNIVELHITSYY